MKLKSSSFLLSHRLVPVALVVMFITMPGYGAPDNSREGGKDCFGLHAGIRAQIVGMKQGFSETPHVMLTFVLLNDADVPIDVAAGSWTLVIDGKELDDSGMIFGNGPGPPGGWRSLTPGESAEFGKALPINQYFSQSRKYEVYWKGKGFRSSAIVVDMEPIAR